MREDKLVASEMYDAEPCQEPQCTEDREPYERYCDAHVTVDCPNCEGCGRRRTPTTSERCPFCSGDGIVSRDRAAKYVPEVTL